MRVLLSTIGAGGDVQPLVALALRVRAPGQEAVQFEKTTLAAQGL